MSGFVEGVPRDQVTLFPDCLDDFVGADSAVRVVDAFAQCRGRLLREAENV